MKKKLLSFALFIALSCAVFGQVWQPKAAGVLPANVNVFDVSVVSDQIIWAVCGDYNPDGPFPADVPMIMRSTDGGENWTAKTIPGATGRYSWDIHAFDENTACITTQDLSTGPGRGIFRTTDGGDTWTEVFHHVAGGLWLHFFDGSQGVCINANNIARTTDAGQNWTAANIPGFQTNEGNIINNTSTSLATLGDNLWFGTWKGRVFRSTNRGADWKVFNAGLGSAAIIFSIDFVDEQNGLALYYFESSPNVYRLARTTDGGEHWTAMPNAPVFSEIAAIPCTKTFVAVKWWSQGTGTFTSSDLGQTWTTAQNSLELWAPFFASPEHGWTATATATGANPALYKWSGEALYGKTFVNQNAAGTNNGKTWADAFTDLKTALAAAKEGDEIWVAEGKHKPAWAHGAQSSTFLIDKDLKLYGGFAGHECLLAERNPALHPTILSGDLNNDDLPNELVVFRDDNVYHVVQVSANVTNAALLDGFNIQGGNAIGSTTFDREGGGMTCSGSPLLRGCVFEQNFAERTGGGARFSSIPGPGIVLENCRFERNQANVAGGMHIISSPFRVSGCTFSDNTAVAGTMQSASGGLRIDASSGSVTHCNFIGNHSALYAGGLTVMDYLGSPGGSKVEVADCHFEGNSAEQSDGGLSFNSWVANNQYAAKRCIFKNNTAVFNGGGLSFYAQPGSTNAQMLFDSCTFSQNHAEGNGGGVFMIGEGKNLKLDFNRCQFSQNTAVYECGAADFWATDGGTGTLTVDSCHFEKDSAFWAGAIEMGSGWGNLTTQFDFVLTNSTFKNNHATEQAGGVLLWSDEKAKTNFLVDNCLIVGNTSAGAGGGIVFLPSSKDFHAELRRCRIVDNSCKTSGGAVAIKQFIPDLPLPTTASLVFENCLLTGNGGLGATVYADSMPNLQFLHCTVARNGDGGIHFSRHSGLTLQNTIIANNLFDNVELGFDNLSTLTSLGGNLLGDSSLGNFATPWDFQNTDPLFAAPGDFHLAPTSPAIDKGVGLGSLTTTDLDGNPRVVGCPDIGAFESPVIVSTDCVIGTGEAAAGASSMTISPNPAGDFLKIEFSENMAAPLELQAFDAAGRSVRFVNFSKVDKSQTLDLQGLAPGLYWLKAVAGERVFAGRFVKI